MEEQELKCPNCQFVAVPKEAGAKIVCGHCGGTFCYVAGEARLTTLGELDKLEQDVAQIKATQEEILEKAGPPNRPARTVDHDQDDPEDEDEEDQ